MVQRQSNRKVRHMCPPGSMRGADWGLEEEELKRGMTYRRDMLVGFLIE
jgi:hypothetical protein